MLRAVTDFPTPMHGRLPIIKEKLRVGTVVDVKVTLPRTADRVRGVRSAASNATETATEESKIELDKIGKRRLGLCEQPLDCEDQNH